MQKRRSVLHLLCAKIIRVKGYIALWEIPVEVLEINRNLTTLADLRVWAFLPPRP